MSAPAWATVQGADLLVRVKAVPGASRSEIVGPLGDHLKVRVAAPPEGGKANAAIAALLAEHHGVPHARMQLESGAAQPRKVFRVVGGSCALGCP